ncbi:MAG: hypothetical protein E6G19_08060 [Actinobacteria bacterium]|nr:MAG: hypothetical protein E6G19_08060 [Actinomycetota bacterium]
MARQKRRREPQQAPPPLPPATRTVGQLVAETIRLYGSRFWRSLALGVAPAAAGLALAESPGAVRLALAFTVAAAAASLSFALATGVVAGERIPRRRLAEAVAFGTLTLAPAIVLLGLLGILGLLPAVIWLGFAGLIVPAITLERRRSYTRAFELARVDLAHSIGSLATLALVGLLTAYVLFFTLRSAGTAALRASAFVSVLVISPLLFLGGALLYYDQVARVGSAPRRRRRNADVHPAVQPDRAGGPDAQVEPGPAARGQ